MRKYASIDFSICNPTKHDGKTGLCMAVPACKHQLLEQEAPFEGPLLSTAMCIGCGECARACPLRAITVLSS
ncbi:MAG: 4Fe-4S binding protein [Spirochaetales bacterium]|nr:4Fe-4S binding protein [Spirochaetales bacterium]